MKVNAITSPIGVNHFKGTREDRNTVSQLTRNNNYSLTDPNQRRINTAIDNLAKLQGEENIQFLINVGDNLQYQTNIQNGRKIKNPWREKLKSAAEQSLSQSDPSLKEKYQPEIERAFSSKPMTEEEKVILENRDSIMAAVGKHKNAGKIQKDLDYFITSTETSTQQKKYILERLAFMMSPDYHINPQLKDKKADVLSEIINDISVNTQDSKIPNIKAINQKTHGSCADISIARKAIAYEDKQNYVDAVLSELDDSDKVMVYDIQHLGSGKRIPVNKVPIDFDYAQERGYRIVDASTLQWMNIAAMYGAQNENLYGYIPFDKENFDAFHDSFFSKDIPDPEIMGKQAFFQSLIKAKDTIKEVKSDKIKAEVKETERRQGYDSNLELAQKLNTELKSTIREILPDTTEEHIQSTSNDLIMLQKKYSADISKNPPELREFSYIPNEESSQKKSKVEKYFEHTRPDIIDRDALDDNSEKIVSIIDEIHSVDSELNPSEPIQVKFAKARELYNAEATFRAARLIGCFDPDYAGNKLIEYNIPDRETRIINGFDEVIHRIEDKNDKTMLRHYSNVIGTSEGNKEEIVNTLKAGQESVQFLTTEVMDDLYKRLGLVDRRNFLRNEIDGSKTQIESGDKNELERSAKCMHVKNDKATVLKELDKLEQRLSDPNDELAITDGYNQIGVKDQTACLVGLFRNFASNLTANDESRNFYVERLKQANGLPEDASTEDLTECFRQLGEDVSIVFQAVQNAENLLDIPTEDNGTYFSVKAHHLLMKRAESKGELVPAKTMRKLQERFAKVDKLRSSDEFSSRQGKISQPELYKFSPEEKEALKQIDKKLNSMYAEVTRNLDNKYREIQEPLEENAQYIGNNTGSYWVNREGVSGLFKDQSAKISEFLTDRPHYEEDDLVKAVEKIKNGVYSGHSSTSVFHNRIGGHGQYIADVKPMGKNREDVLFHDNTWGPSEHENTWVDSEGLTRTDYSDNRGGDIGYITDENLRNGNYVYNLRRKSGHISSDDTNSRQYRKMNPDCTDDRPFQLYSSTLLTGENPEHRNIAGSLKYTIFAPDTIYIGSIQKQAGKMTKKEIQKSIFRIQNAGRSYNDKYNSIIDRINGKDLNKGINSKEDYDSLPDNDTVKLYFEKAAVRIAYDDSNIVRDLAKANTLEKVGKVRAKQKQQAKDNFKYAFGKTPEILNYPGINNGADMVDALTAALDKYKIPYTTDENSILPDIVRNISAYEKDEKGGFTGSIRDTIQFSIDKASKQFDENVPESEDSKKAKEEFLTGLKKILEENMYFTEVDLNAKGEKAEGIRNWIDRKFDPQSDEEFVEIYRSIQDMTTEEFDKLTEDVTDKELGISGESGYDLLVRVKAQDKTAKNALRNTLFYDEYSKDMNLSKTTPAYEYGKTEKRMSGIYYKDGRTFDDLYRTMYFASASLEYEKLFNRYKYDSFKKYNALPSYPRINIFNSSTSDERYDSIENELLSKNAIIDGSKNCIFNYDLIDLLDEYRAQIPSGRSLTKAERNTITHLLGQYVTYNAQEPDAERSLEHAYNALELDKGATIEDYNKHLNPISKEINSMKKVNSREGFKNQIEYCSMYLNEYISQLSKREIPQRYRKTVAQDLKDLSKLLYKNNSTNGLDANRDFLELLDKIDNTSSSDNSKERIEDLFTLDSTIGKTRALKFAEKFDEGSYLKQLEKTNKDADKFVKQFIKPEEQRKIRATIGDYINMRLSSAGRVENSPEAVDNAADKFRRDFEKYHYVSNPTMLLDSFLLESASDSGNENDKSYVDYLKNYLNNQLEYAQLVETQELLVDAVSTGNPAQITKYFDAYTINSPVSGEKISMNSDEAIDLMIRQLIVSDNTETATMLVEKLGLGDRLMNVEKNVISTLNPKDHIDEMCDIIAKHNLVARVVREETDNLLQDIDNQDDPSKAINRLKRKVNKRTKEFDAKKEVKHYLAAMDNAKQFIEENSDLQRSVILKQRVYQAISDAADETNERIEPNKSYLRAIRSLYEFLENITLPEYSESIKTQEELGEDYMKLNEYYAEKIKKANNPEIEDDSGITE